MQKKLKKKLVLKSKIKNMMTKMLLTIIIFIIGMILIKANPDNKVIIQENIYSKSLKFTKIKKIYEKYFGNYLIIDNLISKTEPVSTFKDKIIYKEKKSYNDGVLLTVSNNYMIPSLGDGIVVYIGKKDGYGNTIVIEQTDGIDVFYSNVIVNDLKLYDYIEKGEYLGQTEADKLGLIFQKDGTILNYNDYI